MTEYGKFAITLPADRKIEWVGDSKEDLSVMPCPVKRSFGYGLREIQKGGQPDAMKPMPQFGGGVFELREQFEGNAYRLMYVVKLRKAVYVLDVFMKKSTFGIGLLKHDRERIRARYQRAVEMDKGR